MAYKVKAAKWKCMLGNIFLPVRAKIAYKTPRVSAGRVCDDRTPRPSIKWGGGAGHTARWVTFFGKQRGK
jgi:hypothetical protein